LACVHLEIIEGDWSPDLDLHQNLDPFQHHHHHQGTGKICQTQDISSLLRGATSSKSKANGNASRRPKEKDQQ
jgi:hypothetical protein